MALSTAEQRILTDILSDLFDPHGDTSILNDWEQSFLRDQHERFEKYGTNMFMSAKQWDSLKRIHTKVTGEVH